MQTKTFTNPFDVFLQDCTNGRYSPEQIRSFINGFGTFEKWYRGDFVSHSGKRVNPNLSTKPSNDYHAFVNLLVLLKQQYLSVQSMQLTRLHAIKAHKGQPTPKQGDYVDFKSLGALSSWTTLLPNYVHISGRDRCSGIIDITLRATVLSENIMWTPQTAKQLAKCSIAEYTDPVLYYSMQSAATAMQEFEEEFEVIVMLNKPVTAYVLED
jgi:hypothetical protein